MSADVENGLADREKNPGGGPGPVTGTGAGVAGGVAGGDAYQSGGYRGQALQHSVTPGGHAVQDSLFAIPNAHRKYANPLPLGVFAFSTTTLLLSFYNINVHGIQVPNAVVTYSLAFGGFTQLLAGMWEFATGNTFGATVFTSFGLFWWGYSMLLIPFFGLAANYDGFPGAYAMGTSGAPQETQAIGLFLITWFCITTVFLVASIRSSVGIFSLILALDITFILLAASEWTGNKRLQTAGGAFGILTAAIGFYIGTASLLTPNLSYFVLPLGSLAKDDDADTALPPSNQNGGNTEANTNANANAGGAEYRRPNLKEQFGLAPDPNPTHVVKPTKNTPKLHRTITPGGHPMDNSQPGFPIFHRKTANPVPLGAVGIGSTFMLLGLALVHSRGIDEIAVWYAIGLPLGGLGVLLAGMWSFPEGNTFAATVFGGLGGLILGFSLQELPWTGIRQAYVMEQGARYNSDLNQALGIVLLVSFILVFCLTIASLKTSIPIAFSLLLIQLVFILYGVGLLLNKENVSTAAGGVSIAVGVVMYYVAVSAMLEDEGETFLPVFPLPRSD